MPARPPGGGSAAGCSPGPRGRPPTKRTPSRVKTLSPLTSSVPSRIASVSPGTPTRRLTSVGVESSGEMRIGGGCTGDSKTTTSPRRGSAYPGTSSAGSGSRASVSGTCQRMRGPYTSLLTKSQSPTRSVGTMLSDGMRNASTNTARMKRKIASAPASDFRLSQSHRPAPGLRGRRASATTFRVGLGGGTRFFAATAMRRVVR